MTPQAAEVPPDAKALVEAILAEACADDVETGWHRGTSNHVVALVRGLGLKLSNITGHAIRLAVLLEERDAKAADCGCNVNVSWDSSGVWDERIANFKADITYCPMHAAAGGMVKALDKLPDELAGAANCLSDMRKRGDKLDWGLLERLTQHHIEMQGLVGHANIARQDVAARGGA